MTFTSVLTIGGITLAISLIESILEVMGKEKYVMLIKLIAVSTLGIIGFHLTVSFLNEAVRIFL